MKCEEALDRLDASGELSEAEFQELELHLAGCAACREEERALRALLAEAAALPSELQPARNLWPGIASRIASGNVAGFPARRHWITAASLAAAAAALLALASALMSRTPVVPQQARLVVPSAVPVAVSAVPEALQPAEAEYLRATAELMEALQSRRARLSPETVAALDRDLDIIDGALADLRVALQKDPGSQKLAHMLAATHQRKIEVLRLVMNVKV
jgi:hypothetical protein